MYGIYSNTEVQSTAKHVAAAAQGAAAADTATLRLLAAWQLIVCCNPKTITLPTDDPAASTQKVPPKNWHRSEATGRSCVPFRC
jgi:hypothetical protein